MSAVLFGVRMERIQELSARHASKLANLHERALIVLANDDDITPAEMVAVAKWQLVSGIMSMNYAETAANPGASLLDLAREAAGALMLQTMSAIADG